MAMKHQSFTAAENPFNAKWVIDCALGKKMEFEDHILESANVIWAAGTEPTPTLMTLGENLDDLVRVHVDKDMSLSGQLSYS